MIMAVYDTSFEVVRSQQIQQGGTEPLGIITEITKPSVALIAQQAAHVAGRVVMVNAEALDSVAPMDCRLFPLANSADAALRCQQAFVLLFGQSIFLDVVAPAASSSAPLLPIIEAYALPPL